MAPTTTSFFFGYLDKTTFKDFELQGAASIGGGGRLSLTKHNVPNSVGLVLYGPPIKFADTDGQLTFDTIITFQINHAGSAPPADGIAFFIAPLDISIPPGASGGSLAIFDPSTGYSKDLFAVEFATYDGIPRIGMDKEYRKSDKSVEFKDYLGEKVTAIISYRDRKVTVVAVTDTNTFRASYDVDLKHVLNRYVRVGISASSGNCLENHYVYSWSFNSALVDDEKSG